MAELMDVIRIIQADQARKDAKQIRKHEMNLRLLGLEMAKTQRTEDIMLKEYYNKRAAIEATEKMFEKYQGISPGDISSGGSDILMTKII